MVARQWPTLSHFPTSGSSRLHGAAFTRVDAGPRAVARNASRAATARAPAAARAGPGERRDEASNPRPRIRTDATLGSPLSRIGPLYVDSAASPMVVIA